MRKGLKELNFVFYFCMFKLLKMKVNNSYRNIWSVTRSQKSKNQK